MSNGNEDDWGNTITQIKNPDPIKNGRTWLRHREDTEAAAIDQMILQGTYTIDEMINELTPRKAKTRDHWRRRIEGHIEHLQGGDSWGGARGQIPHKLKIASVAGRYRFDMG